MQHGMTSNTFRAKMALGSWSDGPLFPGIEKVASMLANKSSSAKVDVTIAEQDSGLAENVVDPDLSLSGEDFNWGNIPDTSSDSES
ncbi:hypothetical protein BDQ17DRAFT_1501699 [Cyathus striatus]|nr:hypothetical protein BDQ17DRAFT_1501699 [Cyathus striatus]